MITPCDLKVSLGIRKCTRLGIFDPCSVDAYGNLIFTLTRRRTRMTPDTGPSIDCETVIHCDPSEPTVPS